MNALPTLVHKHDRLKKQHCSVLHDTSAVWHYPVRLALPRIDSLLHYP